MNLNEIIAWLPWICVVLGLLLLLRGTIGKRIDNHAYCTRCGFDLYGLPSDAVRCSECGAEVRQPNAVRYGRRERKANLILAGLVFSIPSILSLGWMAYVSARGGDYERYKPNWWLKADLDDPIRWKRSTSELCRRITAKEINGTELQSLVAQGLDAHAAPLRTVYRTDHPQLVAQFYLDPQNIAWPEILETAQSAGALSKEQWERYVKQSVLVTTQVRPKVQLGRPIPMSLYFIERRFASNFEWVYRVRVSIDGTPVGIDPRCVPVANKDWFGDRPHMRWFVPITDPVVQGLRPGSHSARVEVLCDISDANRGQRITYKDAVFELPFEVVDAPTATVHQDPSLRDRVEKWIGRPRLKRDDVMFHDRPQAVRITCDLHGSHLSIDPLKQVNFCWEVTYKAGDRQWKQPWPVRSQNGFPLGSGGIILDGFDARKVDVILSPSIEAAEQTIDIFDVWNGEIIFRDVPVENMP